MPNRFERPSITLGQAALISLMDRYLKGLLDPLISLLEVHKLMYFLQEAVQRLWLRSGLFSPKARERFCELSHLQFVHDT